MTILDTINLMITLVFDVSCQIYNTQYCKIKKSQKRRIKKESLIDMSTLSYLVLCVCGQITSQWVRCTPPCETMCFVDSNFLQYNNHKSNCEPFLMFHDVSTAKLTCANKFLICLTNIGSIKHRHVLPATYLIRKNYSELK